VSLQNQMNDMLQRLCSLHEANEGQFEDLYAIVGKAGHPPKPAEPLSPEYMRLSAQVEELSLRLGRVDALSRQQSPPKVPHAQAPPGIQARRTSEDSSTSSKANTPMAADGSHHRLTHSPFNTISPQAKHSMASLARTGHGNSRSTQSSVGNTPSSQPLKGPTQSPPTSSLVGYVDPHRGGSPEMRRIGSDSQLRRTAPPLAMPKGPVAAPAQHSPPQHLAPPSTSKAPLPAPSASPQQPTTHDAAAIQPGTPGSGRHEPRTTRENRRKQPPQRQAQALTAANLGARGPPQQRVPPAGGRASTDSNLTFDTSSEHSSDCM
jgi:hypothetical protein